MNTSSAEQHPPIQAVPALKATQIALSFGAIHALSGINLEIPRGQLVAILGPNGAGKSSLISLCLGLQQPNKGKLDVFGQPAGSQWAKQRLGVMLQQAELADNLKVHELIELFRHYYPKPLALQELLAAADLTHLQARYYGKLSGGEKRRVQFALALAGNPDLLFLDEPTTGLDLSARRQLWQRIRAWAAQGRTIVLTTHYLEEAEQLAERIVVLAAGKVIADTTPRQLKLQYRRVRLRCRSQLNTEHPLWQRLRAAPATQTLHLRPSQDGLHLELLSANPEQAARELLAADPALDELEMAGAGLEEAFIALTQSQGPAQAGMEAVS